MRLYNVGLCGAGARVRCMISIFIQFGDLSRQSPPQSANCINIRAETYSIIQLIFHRQSVININII